tara:strand:- start:241 stop:435 length:195 start_codon:yes stop_codon:yes gene_type:complete
MYNLPNEQFDYKNFLLRNSKRYFVIFKTNDIVACVGYDFKINKISKNGCGEGLDKYDMVFKSCE